MVEDPLLELELPEGLNGEGGFGRLRLFVEARVVLSDASCFVVLGGTKSGIAARLGVLLLL